MSEVPPFETTSPEQLQRLVELQSMETVAIQAQIDRIRHTHSIGKLRQHFGRHSVGLDSLGIQSAADYAVAMGKHIRRADLRIFTYISTKPTKYRMWILVGMDNEVVAQYNESKRRMWSFYRQPFLTRFLESGRGRWIEIVVEKEGLELQVW